MGSFHPSKNGPEAGLPTVVVTDGYYRSSIPAVRALGRAGYPVAVTQTRADSPLEPPVFSSRFAHTTHWIEGSWKDADYPQRLLALLERYNRPVLLCIGAATLNMVSAHREQFAQVCDFLIAPPPVLDSLNDKEAVYLRGLELGLPVPQRYNGPPERYPVVVKPHCGERFGLKPWERYAIAATPEEYRAALARMEKYDPFPIVQEQISGDGMGASLLLGPDGSLLRAICHRRVREYPITGGPSTCCVSVYDQQRVETAYRLLQSFHFTGIAMVEFKGDCILEVNPRIWGSFPLTDCAGSSFAVSYARAAAGEPIDWVAEDYQNHVKMRFLLNDSAAIFSCFRHGRWRQGLDGLLDVFRAKEALASREDPKPFWCYLRQNLLKR